jgi:SAM-dependent methyltransferase
MAVPDRIRQAVAALGARPGEHVLEIGCGPGAAVALLCAAGVRVTALDRSAVAVARTRQRNADHVEAGRAVVVCGALADLPADGPLFDAALAVNVNVFWTGPATAELAALRARLRPGAALHLCYEPPTPAGSDRAAAAARSALEAGGFAVAEHRDGPLLHLTGRAGRMTG